MRFNVKVTFTLDIIVVWHKSETFGCDWKNIVETEVQMMWTSLYAKSVQHHWTRQRGCQSVSSERSLRLRFLLWTLQMMSQTAILLEIVTLATSHLTHPLNPLAKLRVPLQLASHRKRINFVYCELFQWHRIHNPQSFL